MCVSSWKFYTMNDSWMYLDAFVYQWMILSYLIGNFSGICSKTYCPYCVRVKELLQQLGAKFKAVELDTESKFRRFFHHEFVSFAVLITFLEWYTCCSIACLRWFEFRILFDPRIVFCSGTHHRKFLCFWCFWKLWIVLLLVYRGLDFVYWSK
jgi:thiol-disulfide isomerase/thioredoxin